jgi:hypothetical protein
MTTFRSDTGPGPPRAAALLVAAGLTLFAPAAVRAQPLPEASPASPPDGAVRGAHPVFSLSYEGIEDLQLSQARFRIVLSEDGFRSEAYVFDQTEQRAGWLPGEPGRMIFRPRRPIRDGTYQWRAFAWDGMSWRPGRGSHTLRVDTIPPADVEDLRLELARESGTLELSWRPVSLDREGGPEFVDRYHVYRYTGEPPYRVAVPLRAASVLATGWTTEIATETGGLVLYRVTAEDEAGNEPLKRR